MKSLHFSILLLGVAATVAWCATPSLAKSTARPNVVVIMADDLGFSDLGCYGSEIETPHLDALAGNGLRFSQFYNTAKCHSSRVSLLTGQYCIAAGDTSMAHGVTTAEVLDAAGYQTMMTGKWHLKREPTDFGFERYFGHLSGATNYFAGDNTFRLDGKPWKVPENNFYTTVANVDYAIDFLRESRSAQPRNTQNRNSDAASTSTDPFYLYVAFNAPHEPLHALPDDYAKYLGRYDDGWDEIRERRLAKQRKLKLFAKDWQPSVRPDHIPAWESLSKDRQGYEINRMTTLAAMIDRLDQEIGRLVAELQANGELDNTMILFVSDNGACPYDRRPPKLNVKPINAATSFPDSTGWAWARNSPFRYYKQNQFEGGISSPAIVHWPAGLKTQPGSVTHQPAHLIDVMPTLVEITGAGQSAVAIATKQSQRDVRPGSGISLTPVFRGQPLNDRPAIHLLFATDRGLRVGDWKLVSFRGQPWELYNLADDRTELNDLADAHPDRVDEMASQYFEIARDTLHSKKAANAKIQPRVLPHANGQWTRFDIPLAESPTKANRRTSRGNQARPIRARKNTALKRSGGEIQLRFTGDDPGIAMDMRATPLPQGPYQLVFNLSTQIEGTGEVFFTVDSRTSLPQGERRSFPIESDGNWHPISVSITDAITISQLRIDIGDGPGEAKIKGLQIQDAAGNILKSW